MKEVRFFYCTDISSGYLPEEEARHVIRVLRLGVGDEINLMDGQGSFFRATITATSGHRCAFAVEEQIAAEREWTGHIHLAMAPTKNIDRTEWLAEKATEIGIDRLSLLNCQFSERTSVKADRLERILVSAMKQSHKAWLPQLDDMLRFQDFIRQENLPPMRFIAHCYDMEDVGGGSKPLLSDILLPCGRGQQSGAEYAAGEGALSAGAEGVSDPLLRSSQPSPSCLVLIGPEGDFSIDEVRAAHACGFRSVSLGSSRLRTETAALVAVHLMRLAATGAHYSKGLRV
ncbi:MAG: 16S rRNA (uracil(1498)-N(3))-methyltransferase [Bacteroidaceae bacterium]|nr:16S rRNA (uracil(1498)-N(3))-methyltransferase [Bacteroidaceae bacterium]